MKHWMQAALDRIDARQTEAERNTVVARAIRHAHAAMRREQAATDAIHADYESGDHLGGQP